MEHKCQTSLKLASKMQQARPLAIRKLAVATSTAAILAISILLCANGASTQSTKGQSNRPTSNSYAPAPSPVAQVRQQQQQQQDYASPSTQATPVRPAAAATKRRPQQPSQQVQQQQMTSYSQQREEQTPATEDPLADSEPALYGSVAGKPGVDFPAYTRIPKTSFTCEGKGFDFGYYADEEAACQVYHVCWSGRRESFLCGVGTVFNQAILACDYWHSVDCSKSSQFYGVNSELGKAGAEPASGSGQTQRQPARIPATLPNSSGSSNNNYGGDQQSRRPIQQQQQYNSNDDSNFDLPQQPVQQQQQQQQQVNEQQPLTQQQLPAFGSKSPATSFNQQQQQLPTAGYGTSFVPQKSQTSYDYQQRVVHSNNNESPSKTSPPLLAPSQSRAQAPIATTTLATPPAKRPRFNMDLNQKVNSLIDSPVRPPIKSSPSIAARQRQTPPPLPQFQQQQQQQPAAQAQASKQPANFAQLAVSRAQQSGSQSLNPGPARKSSINNNNNLGRQQQQQMYDNEIDEPQVQQQQQQQQLSFDDSPVQTSTASNYGRQQTVGGAPFGGQQQQQQQPLSTNLVIQAGGSGDGSSSITTQYDTLTPVGSSGSGNNQSGGSSSADQSYESSLDDSSSNSSDDFRAAGAKAAASHNQNWYIMRTI